MNITNNQLDALNSVLTVEVTAEDYTVRVQKAIKDVAKKASMPGFRPGKVPQGLIKKMYGPGILQEELNKSLQEELDAYVKNNNLRLLGYPLPIPVEDLNLDLESSPSYTFSFEIGLTPEINLSLSVKGLNKYTVDLDDAYLEKEIKMLRKRFGVMTNPDVAEKGDSLFGIVEEVDAEGKVVEGGVSHKLTLNPDMFDFEAAVKSLAGKKAGESFTLDIEKIMKGDKKRGWILNVSPSQYRETMKGKTFRFTIDKINHYEPAELNADFFKRVFPSNTPETEEEFKAKLKENIQGFITTEAEKYFRVELQDLLMKAHNLALPENFLKKWLLQQKENKQTPEEIEKTFPAYAKGLQWALLRDAIVRLFEKEVEVTEEELKAEAKEKARSTFGDMAEDQLDAFAGYFLQNQESVNQMFEELQDKKLYARLEAEVKPAVKSISATEFETL